jgi:hypothetical protein
MTTTRRWFLGAAAAIAVAGVRAQGGATAQGSQGSSQGFAIGERLAPQSRPPVAPAPGSAPREITWDDLIPRDWNPLKTLQSLDLSKLEDSDPRASEAMAQLRAEWDRAPIVPAMAGQRVRIAGFVVPLETTRQGVQEFLLVPYFGACIHVPPPPANQVVHVKPDRPVPEKTAQQPVWIAGVIQAARSDTAYGTAGYRMSDARVEPWVAPKSR